MRSRRRQSPDRFEQVNGSHPGFRRNHSKGVCVTGYFIQSGQGSAISKAAIFQQGRVPVIGRFSLAGGQPFAIDASHTARGTGDSRFKLAGWRGMAHGRCMISPGLHPVKERPRLSTIKLLAMAPDDKATGKPDLAKVAAFLFRVSGIRKSPDEIDSRTAGIFRI